jgi:tetratricopeptide (TPR) repeat protein
MSQKGQLSQTERRHLEAAEGWLGLGSWTEAQKELDAIVSPAQGHPRVLQLRWAVSAAHKDWLAGLEVAAALIQCAPDDASGWVHRSYCLHELKRTQEARDNLLRVVDQFKSDTTIRYNLACYECQLGRLDQALTWLQKACTLGGTRRISQMALADPDLEPLRNDIVLALRRNTVTGQTDLPQDSL